MTTLDKAAVDHMVSRFLRWKLPEDFSPDGGISFERNYNQNTPWPAKHEPVGTNLFTATQAKAMVQHMLADCPVADAPPLADAAPAPSPSPVREVVEEPKPTGMSLRDWFAGQALAAVTAGSVGWVGRADAGELAYRAYAVADAMLAARNSAEAMKEQP